MSTPLLRRWSYLQAHKVEKPQPSRANFQDIPLVMRSYPAAPVLWNLPLTPCLRGFTPGRRKATRALYPFDPHRAGQLRNQ